MDRSEVTVTPAQAEEWLHGPQHNRKLKPVTIARYAAEMRAGMWIPGVAEVWFDTDGAQCQGQHTLHAIIESGTTQELCIVTGAPPEAFEVLDTGAKRTARDTLGMLGAPDPQVLAPVVRYTLAIAHRSLKMRWFGTVTAVPNAVIDEAYLLTRDRWDDAVAVAKYGRFVGLQSPLGSLAAMVTHDWVQAFAIGLSNGAGLENDDSRLLLRNRMLTGDGRKLADQDKFELLFRAWDAFVTNTSLRQLKLGRDTAKLPEHTDMDFVTKLQRLAADRGL